MSKQETIAVVHVLYRQIGEHVYFADSQAELDGFIWINHMHPSTPWYIEWLDTTNPRTTINESEAGDE